VSEPCAHVLGQSVTVASRNIRVIFTHRFAQLLVVHVGAIQSDGQVSAKATLERARLCARRAQFLDLIEQPLALPAQLDHCGRREAMKMAMEAQRCG